MNYEAAEDAYMKVTGGVSPRGIREAVEAAVGDKVLYEIPQPQAAWPQALDDVMEDGWVVQFYPEVK